MSGKTVFISYSHDSEAHAQRVRGLGASLSRGGCDCRIDVYKDTGEDWRLAHQRLYEHLCKHKDGDTPTLADLQPLYQAVAHGCQAGMQQKACNDVYFRRILRGKQNYSTFRLGAIGSDMGAQVCFFEKPWNRISLALTEADQAWLLNEAAFRLRALGRLTEALEPARLNLRMRVERKEWQHAPSSAGNLSELELTLGAVAGAVADAEQAVAFADRSGDAFQMTSKRTTLADARHQAGERDQALVLFREAEAMQAKRQPQYPLLYSVQGFQYCDLLLAEAERAAWGRVLGSGFGVQERSQAGAAGGVECGGKRQRDAALASATASVPTARSTSPEFSQSGVAIRVTDSATARRGGCRLIWARHWR